MASNLRDRGYSSSMDGYNLKLNKADERHSRKKTVAPGDATVSKGQKVTNSTVKDSAVMRLPSPEQIRSTPISVPEYGPVGLPPSELPYSPNTPINLHYSDPLDQVAQYRNVEIPYRMNSSKQNPAANMSTDEIKRRMDEIEQALSLNYTKQAQDRQRRRGYKWSSDPSTLEEELTAAKTVSDYNWEMHDFLDDWMPDLTNDPVALASEQMEHAKAAAAGRVNNEKLNTQNRFDAGYNRLTQDIISDEASIDQLYWEYNNLKNEYNVRLAQYLQGLR